MRFCNLKSGYHLEIWYRFVLIRSKSKCIVRLFFGTWRSLVSAPALGAGSREFESHRPDHSSLES